jgi:arsenate reductase
VTSHDVFNCLFLCTGNSARSVMAESILTHYGHGSFRAYSAGSRPTGRINPDAQDLLRRLGMPLQGVRSKSWDEFAVPGAPSLDFVFTVCDNAVAEACPVWPGQPLSAHWEVADPAAVSGDEIAVAGGFRRAFRELEHRIRIFVSLPFAALDSLRLQQQLEEIGQALPDADRGKLSRNRPSRTHRLGSHSRISSRSLASTG